MGPVNSILDWNDNLATIFEAKLTKSTGLQVQSLSIVFCLRRRYHYVNRNIMVYKFNLVLDRFF